MLFQLLKDTGLSEKEAQVYLKLLELNTTSAFELAKKIGSPHSTIYVILGSLSKKGLVSKFEQQGSTKFSALDPTNLFSFLEKQKQEILSKEEELKKGLAELNTIFLSSQDRPVVRFYEGLSGYEALENDADKLDQGSGDTAYSFSPYDVFEQFNPDKSSIQKRIKRGKKIKLIYTHKNGVQHLTDPKISREARFLPRNQFPFEASISIIPNHSVRMFSYRKGFIGIWVDNPEIANTLKIIFDICWQKAQKEK